jgi:hypothetical protein
MDTIFDLCVRILLYLADLFGTSYKAINVWIFVIIWPIITLVLIVLIFIQYRTIQGLKSQLTERNG